MRIIFSFATLSFLLLSACGGGGGGGGRNCDNALTVSYVQNQIAEFPGFSESNTTIVHTDGDQGNTYDVDVVAVSRTSHDMDESLAFSYSVFGTASPPVGTYGAFYLDTDKSASTGMMVGTMGADALVVSSPGGSANGFFLWNDGAWVKQSVLGSLGSNASYFQGCTHSTTVYAPLYSGLSSLYSTPVTGVVKVLTINTSDPIDVTGILDSSSQFDFIVP